MIGAVYVRTHQLELSHRSLPAFSVTSLAFNLSCGLAGIPGFAVAANPAASCHRRNFEHHHAISLLGGKDHTVTSAFTFCYIPGYRIGFFGAAGPGSLWRKLFGKGHFCSYGADCFVHENFPFVRAGKTLLCR